MSGERGLSVVIVGAGFGGLAAAIELRRHGFADVTVLERASGVGGTWHYNDYPGCACDVPSHLYSFSFAQRRHWSRLCSPQPEILRYLEEVARDDGVAELVRHGVHVVSCRWDDGSTAWTVAAADGRSWRADAVVIATGQLHQPSVPRIEGLEEFDGVSFHSARWDHAYDLAGKRVAVIGTGASAVQFVPEIAAAGGAPVRVPAHRQLVPAAPEPRLSGGWCGRDPVRAGSAGAPAAVHLLLRRVADDDDPPPAYGRADRAAAVGAVHALAAARPRGPAQGVARLHVRLQARAVQLALPAGAAAAERRARDRADRAVHGLRGSSPPTALCARWTA